MFDLNRATQVLIYTDTKIYSGEIQDKKRKETVTELLVFTIIYWLRFYVFIKITGILQHSLWYDQFDHTSVLELPLGEMILTSGFNCSLGYKMADMKNPTASTWKSWLLAMLFLKSETLEANRLWALILATACLQLCKHTNRAVSRLKWVRWF